MVKLMTCEDLRQKSHAVTNLETTKAQVSIPVAHPRFPFTVVVAAVLFTHAAAAFAHAQQLTFTTRIEVRTSPWTPPSNPIVAQLVERITSTIDPLFERIGDGWEFVTTVSDAGARLQFHRGGPEEMRGGTTLHRPDGEVIVLRPGDL